MPMKQPAKQFRSTRAPMQRAPFAKTLSCENRPRRYFPANSFLYQRAATLEAAATRSPLPSVRFLIGVAAQAHFFDRRSIVE
jgi:hypothetical protein